MSLVNDSRMEEAPETGGRREPVPEPVADLVRKSGGDPDTFAGRLIGQLIATSLKLISDGHDVGQVKLMTAAMKVGSSRVDLQACKLEYSIVSPK